MTIRTGSTGLEMKMNRYEVGSDPLVFFCDMPPKDVFGLHIDKAAERYSGHKAVQIDKYLAEDWPYQVLLPTESAGWESKQNSICLPATSS